MIEVHQFPTKDFPEWVEEVIGGADGDFNLMEDFGFNGLKRLGDPLDLRHVRPKVYVFEFRGSGEVKQRWLSGGA